jgi:hypothetical protein
MGKGKSQVREEITWNPAREEPGLYMHLVCGMANGELSIMQCNVSGDSQFGYTTQAIVWLEVQMGHGLQLIARKIP